MLTGKSNKENQGQQFGSLVPWAYINPRSIKGKKQHKLRENAIDFEKGQLEKFPWFHDHLPPCMYLQRKSCLSGQWIDQNVYVICMVLPSSKPELLTMMVPLVWFIESWWVLKGFAEVTSSSDSKKEATFRDRRKVREAPWIIGFRWGNVAKDLCCTMIFSIQKVVVVVVVVVIIGFLPQSDGYHEKERETPLAAGGNHQSLTMWGKGV